MTRATYPFGLGGIVLLAAALSGRVEAAPLPTQVGQCSETTISAVTSRLKGAPDSGSALVFANGGHQVSYEIVPEVARSRKGDPVRMCLTDIPVGCPPGDDRGRIYRTINLRTKEGWQLPDSQHSCGGA